MNSVQNTSEIFQNFRNFVKIVVFQKNPKVFGFKTPPLIRGQERILGGGFEKQFGW